MRLLFTSKYFDLYFCTPRTYDPIADEFFRDGFNIRFGKYVYNSKNGWRNLYKKPSKEEMKKFMSATKFNGIWYRNSIKKRKKAKANLP